MPYSEPEDMLIGDLIVGAGISKEMFVVGAAEEMDSKLGFIYKLPLEPADPQLLELPTHQQLLLKTINNRLASGRMILALDVAEENVALHAYGASLVREALADLMALANGLVLLDAQKIAGEETSTTGPGIVNHDSESLLLGFENTVLRGVPWFTRPGQV